VLATTNSGETATVVVEDGDRYEEELGEIINETGGEGDAIEEGSRTEEGAQADEEGGNVGHTGLSNSEGVVGTEEDKEDDEEDDEEEDDEEEDEQDDEEGVVAAAADSIVCRRKRPDTR